MWVTVVDTVGNTYNEKNVYNFAIKDTTWKYGLDMAYTKILNVYVSDVNRTLVLQTTTG